MTEPKVSYPVTVDMQIRAAEDCPDEHLERVGQIAREAVREALADYGYTEGDPAPHLVVVNGGHA